jgi:hypothetical protein
VASPNISTTRLIKTFQVQNGAWDWVSDLSLPA